jgi:endonuclease YncB( thermonuclease family)
MRLPVLAAAAVALTLPAPAAATTSTGIVVRVVDGDTVKVRLGPRTRTVHLKAVAAPRECYRTQARSRLRRMLPKGTRVKVKMNGSPRAEIVKAGRSVNRAMVRGGHARAKRGGGRLGRRLRRDEARAERRDRGLWKACDEAPGGMGGPDGTGLTNGSEPGDLGGQEATARLRLDLQNAAFRTFNNSGDLSEKSQLDICGSGDFRYHFDSTYLSGGFSVVQYTEKFGNPWTIAEALVRADGSYRGARVRGTFTTERSNSGGGTSQQPINEASETLLELQNGQWYWDKRPAQYMPGQANCAPSF